MAMVINTEGIYEMYKRWKLEFWLDNLIAYEPRLHVDISGILVRVEQQFVPGITTRALQNLVLEESKTCGELYFRIFLDLGYECAGHEKFITY